MKCKNTFFFNKLICIRILCGIVCKVERTVSCDDRGPVTKKAADVSDSPAAVIFSAILLFALVDVHALILVELGLYCLALVLC